MWMPRRVGVSTMWCVCHVMCVPFRESAMRWRLPCDASAMSCECHVVGVAVSSGDAKPCDWPVVGYAMTCEYPMSCQYSVS